MLRLMYCFTYFLLFFMDHKYRIRQKSSQELCRQIPYPIFTLLLSLVFQIFVWYLCLSCLFVAIFFRLCAIFLTLYHYRSKFCRQILNFRKIRTFSAKIYEQNTDFSAEFDHSFPFPSYNNPIILSPFPIINWNNNNYYFVGSLYHKFRYTIFIL